MLDSHEYLTGNSQNWQKEEKAATFFNPQNESIAAVREPLQSAPKLEHRKFALKGEADRFVAVRNTHERVAVIISSIRESSRYV